MCDYWQKVTEKCKQITTRCVFFVAVRPAFVAAHLIFLELQHYLMNKNSLLTTVSVRRYSPQCKIIKIVSDYMLITSGVKYG